LVAFDKITCLYIHTFSGIVSFVCLWFALQEYIGTMGADYIQYLITDRVASPRRYESYYSEKVPYIHTYIHTKLINLCSQRVSYTQSGDYDYQLELQLESSNPPADADWSFRPIFTLTSLPFLPSVHLDAPFVLSQLLCLSAASHVTSSDGAPSPWQPAGEWLRHREEGQFRVLQLQQALEVWPDAVHTVAWDHAGR
jgi:hypothetical protein